MSAQKAFEYYDIGENKNFHFKDQLGGFPYNPELEVIGYSEGRLSEIDLYKNLMFALQESFRLGLMSPYYSELRSDGQLYPAGSNIPLRDLYAKERLITKIDRDRADGDLRGVAGLEQLALKYRWSGQKPGFSLMISPDYGIGSGVVMIEISKIEGTQAKPIIKSQRLAIPKNQFPDGLNQREFIIRLIEKLQPEILSFKDEEFFPLGHLINREESDPIKFLDEQIREILGEKPFYGFSPQSLSEQISQFEEIYRILGERGVLSKLIESIKKYAGLNRKLNAYEIQALIGDTAQMLNVFLDLRENIRSGIALTQIQVEKALQNQIREVTRNASGYCPSSLSKNHKLIDAIKKYGSDSKGQRAVECPKCGEISIRPFEGFLESCAFCGQSLRC
jgi:hypothetical protein